MTDNDWKDIFGRASPYPPPYGRSPGDVYLSDRQLLEWNGVLAGLQIVKSVGTLNFHSNDVAVIADQAEKK